MAEKEITLAEVFEANSELVEVGFKAIVHCAVENSEIRSNRLEYPLEKPPMPEDIFTEQKRVFADKSLLTSHKFLNGIEHVAQAGLSSAARRILALEFRFRDKDRNDFDEGPNVGMETTQSVDGHTGSLLRRVRSFYKSSAALREYVPLSVLEAIVKLHEVTEIINGDESFVHQDVRRNGSGLSHDEATMRYEHDVAAIKNVLKHMDNFPEEAVDWMSHTLALYDNYKRLATSDHPYAIAVMLVRLLDTIDGDSFWIKDKSARIINTKDKKLANDLMENSTVDLRNPIMTEIEDGNNITYRIDIPQKNFQQDTTTQYLQVKKVWENRIKAYIEVLHELGINDELLRSTENLIEDHFEGYANIGIHMPFHRETVRKPHHARALREREYGGTNEQGELDGIRIAVDIDDFLTKMRDVFLETACREIWHVNYHENAYRMNWFGYFNEDADIWEDLGIGRDGYLRAVDVLFKQNGCDDFHENLRPYVDAIEAIRELEEMGAEIIYLTSREDIDQEISGTVCVCDCSGTIVNLKNRMATQRQLDDFGLPEGKLVTKNRENTIGLEEGKNWKAKMVKQLGGFDVIIDDQVANISCTLEELEAMGKKPLGINTDPDLKGNMRFGKVYAGFRIEHKKDIPRLVREWKKIRDRVRIKKREFFSELD